MKYVIRKVPERNTEYLERLLPNPTIYNDEKHVGALYSFLNVLEETKDDAVYIQDDVILGKDFVKKAEAYIEKYPWAVIVFTNMTIDKKCKDVKKEGWYDAKKGCWLYCTYIPHDIAEQFIAWWEREEWKKYNKNWVKWQFDDAFFSRFLFENKLDVFVVIPNLAGHPKNESVISKRKPRVSENFDFENAEK